MEGKDWGREGKDGGREELNQHALNSTGSVKS